MDKVGICQVNKSKNLRKLFPSCNYLHHLLITRVGVILTSKILKYNKLNLLDCLLNRTDILKVAFLLSLICVLQLKMKSDGDNC